VAFGSLTLTLSPLGEGRLWEAFGIDFREREQCHTSLLPGGEKVAAARMSGNHLH
jgi:hypothetical protein